MAWAISPSSRAFEPSAAILRSTAASSGLRSSDADGQRLAVGLEEIGGGDRVFLQVLLASAGCSGAALTLKPPSASVMAGSNSCAQGSLPCCRCAISSMRTVPGTPTERPPTTAVVERQRLAVGAEEQLFVGGGGRGFAAVERLDLACR